MSGRRLTSASARTRALPTAIAACLSVTAASAEPSRSVQDYRSHMFDPPVRVLANRSLASMFNTAPVAAGGRSSPLPVAPAALNFSYQFGGTTHPATDIIERTFTDGLLIIKDGRIVHEGYYNQAGPTTHFNSWSMAKSLNALMVGIALRQGKIASVTDPIVKYVPELKGSGYDGTTIRDLMEMRSGTDWSDNFFSPTTASYAAHVASWVKEAQRYTDYAPQVKRKHAPGTVWNYNSMDAGLVGLVVERATGMPVSRYLADTLWKPAGMEADAFYVLDGPPGLGREFTAGGFDAVLRDYGRLGLLMLNGGRAGARTILAPDFVADATRSISSAGHGLGYGWFWWTVPGERAFTALGGEGQFIFVDPATRTVIVKMSHGPVGPESGPMTDEAMAFFKAASRWSGR